MRTTDIIFKNFMKIRNPDVKFVSSVSYLDIISSKAMVFGAFVCLVAVTVLPLATAGHFSMILYSFVVETEKKTKHMMIIHGTNNVLYYLVNYFYFMIMCTLGSLIFIIASILILDLPIFVSSSTLVLFLVYCLYSHAQICLAILFQNFSISTRISTGKIISVWAHIFDCQS